MGGVTFYGLIRVINVNGYPSIGFEKRGDELSDDNSMMELVQSGDKEAFETLVLKHRISAIRFAQRYIRDEFIAEDIVQDSFTIIYVKRMDYKTKYSFKTFLYTIIRNKCIDYLRKNKNLSIDDVEIMTSSAEEVVMHREERKEIIEMVSTLKKEYQRAIYLYQYECMSYKEIAMIMNKTVPQVKITIFRARKKIQKAVEEGYK
jgi:RNA polymerase sigma factor (sigma-70 family)